MGVSEVGFPLKGYYKGYYKGSLKGLYLLFGVLHHSHVGLGLRGLGSQGFLLSGRMFGRIMLNGVYGVLCGFC